MVLMSASSIELPLMTCVAGYSALLRGEVNQSVQHSSLMQADLVHFTTLALRIFPNEKCDEM